MLVPSRADSPLKIMPDAEATNVHLFIGKTKLRHQVSIRILASEPNNEGQESCEVRHLVGTLQADFNRNEIVHDLSIFGMI
jgi:hypothetical protein